ncbi:hypothetical protein NECAME_18511, partial [Necator americanus]
PLQSYSAPAGSAGDGISFTDSSYDGTLSNHVASGGLGRLSDGVIGEDTEDLYPHRWVGWRKQSGGHINILFTFSEPRNFTSIHIHTLFSNKLNAQ